MKSDAVATILVINCGSSSLKFRIIRMPGGEELAEGEAVRVGIRTSQSPAIHYRIGGGKKTVTADLPDHSAAFRNVVALLAQAAQEHPELRYDCFAHRFVHPGTHFSRTTRIDTAAIAKLRETFSLAPIHNVISLNLIEMCSREHPDVPQYAVFDTGFHRTIPKELASYALPASLAKKYSLRKYGFHGISHRYVMEESCRFLGREPATLKIISCHLGSGGSSVCAIQDGVSLNNSMGFTPLEGLMMNTRSGDLDIGVLFHIMAQNGLSAREAEKLLNNKSGVLGVFAASSDMRDVTKGRRTDAKAAQAFDMYVRRVRRYVGYYALLLHKADVLIFTDTLGIEVPELRRAICDGMECFGIRLDAKKNEAHSSYTLADLTGEGSQTKILAVPTNEEIMIARETYKEYCDDHHN